MTKRTSFLLCAGILATGLLWWRHPTMSGVAAQGRPGRSAGEAPDAGLPTAELQTAKLALAATAGAATAVTRSEAVEAVRALYRKEQLTRELDLEQQRYSRSYWQTGCDGRALAQLQRARVAMIRELSAEANQVLNDLFPGETGEPIWLPAFFEVGRAGPNITFLAAAERARFESEILADDSDRGPEAGRLLDLARRVLPADEFEVYQKWNDPAAAALREQLVGFNQTESEFAAILDERRRTDEERETRSPDASLESQLGAGRFSEWRKLEEPAMHTALADLQRLGLPLDQAEWLAATRARALADIGAIWRSPDLTEAMKREQVAQTERAYGWAIAARFALPEGSLDGLAPHS